MIPLIEIVPDGRLERTQDFLRQLDARGAVADRGAVVSDLRQYLREVAVGLAHDKNRNAGAPGRAREMSIEYRTRSDPPTKSASPSASPVTAMSGAAVRPVSVPDELPLDESWAEPAAFDGCTSHGQSRPGGAQRVNIVRSTSAMGVRS